MKNQDKATANYAKQISRKKDKLLTRPEDVKDSTINLLSKCRFCEKEHWPNECWHLQAECHYCHATGHIAKFCKKKSSPQASPRQVVICIQNIPCFSTLIQAKAFPSCTLNAEFPGSSVQKVIVDSGATDHFFSNDAYFST